MSFSVCWCSCLLLLQMFSSALDRLQTAPTLFQRRSIHPSADACPPTPGLPRPPQASPAPVTLRCTCRPVSSVYMLSLGDGGGKQCRENRAVITHRRWRDACAHTAGGRAVWGRSNDLFNSSQLVRKIKGTHLRIYQQQIHTTDNNHPENKGWWGRFSGGLVELEFSRIRHAW